MNEQLCTKCRVVVFGVRRDDWYTSNGNDEGIYTLHSVFVKHTTASSMEDGTEFAGNAKIANDTLG